MCIRDRFTLLFSVGRVLVFLRTLLFRLFFPVQKLQFIFFKSRPFELDACARIPAAPRWPPAFYHFVNANPDHRYSVVFDSPGRSEAGCRLCADQRTAADGFPRVDPEATMAFIVGDRWQHPDHLTCEIILARLGAMACNAGDEVAANVDSQASL